MGRLSDDDRGHLNGRDARILAGISRGPRQVVRNLLRRNVCVISPALRKEALLLLDHRGAILDVAREISALMRDAELSGVVIGGIAVVMHGYVRTTLDVEILIGPPLDRIVNLLTSHGFHVNATRQELTKNEVRVQIVPADEAGREAVDAVDIEGITVASLPDLINIKLRSGSTNLLRAQDLGDVIGLARENALSSSFARHLDKELRPAFRKMIRALAKEPH
jgi:hypothetical protein